MITADDSTKSAVIKLCDGNPGALSVLVEILKTPMGMIYLLHLDDMGLKGPAIWIGYKDHCGQDLNKFLEALRSRDPLMVETIRREGYPAVESGASYSGKL